MAKFARYMDEAFNGKLMAIEMAREGFISDWLRMIPIQEELAKTDSTSGRAASITRVARRARKSSKRGKGNR
jgi:hypothetical protein